MKKYFSFLLTIVVSFAIALSFSSCQAEIEPESEVETGFPVEGLTFSFSTPMDEVVVTKASAVAETQVLNFTMIFIPKDDSGAIVITKDLYNEQRVTETNYLYSVSLSADDLAEIHTGQYYLYAIANTGNGFISVDPASLSGMKKNQIDNVIIKKNDRQVQFTDASVLMSGKYCEGVTFGDDDSDSCNGLITLHSGENKPSGRIHLRRSVSKSIFTIKTKAGVEFKPVSYDIVNFAQGEYLFEKAGAGFWNGSIPGSVPAVPGVEYISRTGLTNFETNADGSIGFSFYMPESVQKAYPSLPASWTYASRETRNYSESDHYGPFSYAPANAAYIVVRGSYKDSQYTGDATYTIHLGDFGQSTGAGHFDNFTVRRNYKYNYAVTVNSVSKIIAEAQSTSDSEQPGAEGNIRALTTTSSYTLDAHYETVLVSMPYDGADEYTVMAETPFGRSQVSRANGAGQISASDKAKLDYNWIRFAKPAGTGSSMTAASYPGESGTVDVFTLLDEIVARKQNPSTSDHYTITGTGDSRTIYTVAYVNENYYDVNPLTGGSVEMIEFVNRPNRSLTAAFAPIHVSRDEHSTFAQDKGFTISQRAIRTFFNLDETKGEVFDNPFGIETIEETASASASVSENTDDFGWFNFKDALGTRRSWNTYLNLGSNVVKIGGDAKDNEHRSDIMANTNSFFQCLSRNRDENNNGRIDDEEIKWYLPSHVECLQFWYGMNGLEPETRLPLYADNVGGDINYITSTGGYAGIWWANEGSAFSQIGYATRQFYVRCVRALGKGTHGEGGYNQPTSLLYSFDGNNVIDVSGLSENCSRVGTMKYEYEPHFRNNQTYDLLPSGFQVAEKDLQIGGSSAVTVISPRISAVSNGNGTFTIKLLNYESFVGTTYKVSINDGAAQNPEESYVVTPAWHDNQSTISVRTVITLLDQDFRSNKASTVDVSRIAASGVDVPAPTGTDNITRSGSAFSGYSFSHAVRINNYDSEKYLYYFTFSDAFSTSYPITERDFTTPSTRSGNTIYVWAVPRSDKNNDEARSVSSASRTSTGNTSLSSLKVGKIYDVTGYTVGEVSNSSNGEVSVPERNRFTLSEVKGSNLCASFYSQDEGGEDLHQWRIPNEKELGLMFQFKNPLGIIVMTSALSQYTRAASDRAPEPAIYTIRNNNYNSFTGSADVVSTSVSGTGYFTDRVFVVRCVRDVEPRSDQGSGSGSGGSGDGGTGSGVGGENNGGSGPGGSGTGSGGGFQM